MACFMHLAAPTTHSDTATMATAAAAPFVRCLLPRPPPSSSLQKTSDSTSYASSNKRSRLVLLQHTADLTTRLTASSPADAGSGAPDSGGGRRGRRGNTNPRASSATAGGGAAVTTSEDALYRLAGLRTPSESATRDLSGGLLVLSALEEVASRTGGRVVWVTAANNLSVPKGGEGDNANINGWATEFHRHGATVDLASDPLGWDVSDDDDDDDDDGDEEEKKGKEESGGVHRYYSSRMDSLRAVLATIQRAAASIASAEDGEAAAAGEIPVIFDSIVPLLSFHGSAKTFRFLQHLLRRGITSNISEGDNTTSHKIAISPLVAPILVEGIRPADMRQFEDGADSIVTLSGGEMRTTRRGGGDGKVGGAAGRLGTDFQQFALEQNQQQKSFIGGNTERLILLNSSEQNDKERRRKGVVQRKIKATTEASADELLQPATAKLASMEIASPSPQAPPGSSTSQRGRPTLQIGEEGRDAATAAATEETTNDSAQNQPTTKSGPRIFVQDDDPEFDDLDEEDLDDDLDL